MESSTKDQLIDLMDGQLNRAAKLYLETCSRCGVCIKACHVHESMPFVKYIPAHRAEVVRRIFKKYFKTQGKIFPSLGEAKELNENALQEMNEAAYSCTSCRRCVLYCPFGIDTSVMMSIAKYLLVGASAEPEMLTMLADTSIEKGKSLDQIKDNFVKAIKNLEKDVIEKWQSEAGKDVIPIDVEGADMLYVALAGAHSIIPAAAIFNSAGEKWTLSFFEAVNFGAFVGDPVRTKIIADRIINEARRLKVKEVCICECGTAFRVLKHIARDEPFEVVSITDVHARYIKDERIKIDRSKFNEPITYHDPCQIARNGGVIDEPRYIINHITDDFRELSPDPRYNWCCGGGGGLVSLGEETLDFRMKSSKVKVDQIKSTGAKILTTACENCHTQLSNLNEHYQLGLEVKFLSSIIADALV